MYIVSMWDTENWSRDYIHVSRYRFWQNVGLFALAQNVRSRIICNCGKHIICVPFVDYQLENMCRDMLRISTYWQKPSIRTSLKKSLDIGCLNRKTCTFHFTGSALFHPCLATHTVHTHAHILQTTLSVYLNFWNGTNNLVNEFRCHWPSIGSRTSRSTFW